ncbi:GNAT family N-acetyltransferase [Phenylobacterium sp.]|uniref:GNAT family N-acetyltransferase n=1 Tax=Phenylobacterium sp. TaxID=1871053 RepID=UPI002E35EA9F|nr:GNAT family N-acetyltransferase [Phenylobacterium sp.]HEX2561700.1 GNAT family N-acetyltransferase [Phenylobacterium sp.]
MNGLALIALDAEATFLTRPDGRITAENEPTPAPAPRMFLAGSADGNLLRLRDDVDPGAAREIERLVADEPPLAAPEAQPCFLPRYRELLDGAEPQFGLSFELPHGLAPAAEAEFVYSGAPAGEALMARFQAEGMPPQLAANGFGDVDEFWAPWCLAQIEGEAAAIAFAARLGPKGAALGLVTFPQFRGRGLGAAVTAAWTRHPELSTRRLFYGCSRENLSSRRVVERLGLRFIGPTLRLV